MSSSSSNCSICLTSAEARGGVPLFAPGCCGKWFHQTCMDALKAQGEDKCPMCRKPFPNESKIGLGVFNFRGTSTIQASSSPGLEEELVNFSLATGNSSAGTETSESAGLDGTASPNVEVTTSAEFSEVHVDAVSEFFVRINIKYAESEDMEGKKVPLDIVCILDNSGSMGGGKLDSLKTAMNFIIDTLSPDDRLSVVNFNSTSTTLHDLIKMNETNKTAARSKLNSLHAGGGTDILSGMQRGWTVLENRKSHNPASCVFLLTDGQDRGNLSQKLDLAKAMKANGTSLFVFGFGADHDSQHMEAIANAAEGNFTYIESDDMVTDAFGGTIGMQQGVSLSNISLSIQACEREVVISQILSGKYTTFLQPDGRAGTVSFVNMYMGESRDVLLKVSLPSVGEAIEDYEVINAVATFQLQGQPDGDSLRHSTPSTVCKIQRLPSDRINPDLLVRNVEVDVQLNRIDCTTAVNGAMLQADASNFGAARDILAAVRERLLNSVSFKAKHSVVVAMMQEIDDAISRVRSRRDYDYGGRAMMTEVVSANSYQRCGYSKAGRVAKYQTSRSKLDQQNGCLSKGK